MNRSILSDQLKMIQQEMRGVQRGDVSTIVPTRIYSLAEVAIVLDCDPRSIKRSLSTDGNGLKCFKVGMQFKFVGQHIIDYIGVANEQNT